MEFHSRIPGTGRRRAIRNDLNDLGTYRQVNRTLHIPPVEYFMQEIAQQFN